MKLRADSSPSAGAPARCAPIAVGVRLLTLGLVLCAVGGAQSSNVVARASSVSGRALLVNSTAGAPIALTAGYILAPGDRVDTRGGGRVVIELSDGSMVVVSPESVVTLKDFRAANSLRELFEITLGIVRVKINHFGGKPNPYRMNSPTASIAVRGTEFTIEVDASGATQVTVIEGAVEVTSLADPARSILLQAGQSFRLLAGNLPPPQPPGNRADGDRRGEPGQPPPPPNNMAQGRGPEPHGGDGPGGAVPGPQPQAPQPQAPQPQQAGHDGKGGMPPPHNDRDHDDASPRANAGVYDRYLAGLADIGQVPFLLRYNAFPESHLDAVENPAYATTFRSAEGRFFFLPTFHGAQTLQENQGAFGPGGALPSDYSISPQISFFAPAGGFNVGGSAAFSRVGSGSSISDFYSGALVAAHRFDSNSLGIELAGLKGTGTDGEVSETRLTLGYALDFGRDTRLGAYYRYSFIDTTPGPAAAGMRGHSWEVGLRLRGAITPRLYYGFAGSWLGVSLLDGAHRGSAAVGLGYSLSSHTILTFDLAGGASHNFALRTQGDGAGRFVSMHGAVQHDVTRRLFVTASLMQVWQSNEPPVAALGARFSDYGAGWRFTPNVWVQYIYSTNYGATAATHSLMLRYTFGKGR